MKNLAELITLASIAFGISLSVKLILLKKHGMIPMWLSFYVILLVASLCEIFLPEGSIPGIIIGAGYWLLGPCLYLYVRNRLQTSTPQKSVILHFIPFIVYVTTVFLSTVFDLKDESGIADVLVYELVFIHILIYLILALILILKTKKLRPIANDQSRAMQLASMQVIAILSITLFAISWTSTNIIAFAALQPDKGNYQLMVQAAMTLLIFSIALLNTETRYAESFD
jgi:hypothetical protein